MSTLADASVGMRIAQTAGHGDHLSKAVWLGALQSAFVPGSVPISEHRM